MTDEDSFVVALPVADTLEHSPSPMEQHQPDEEQENQESDATSETSQTSHTSQASRASRSKSTRMQLGLKGNRESGVIPASPRMQRNPHPMLQQQQEGDRESRALEDLGTCCGLQVDSPVAVCVPNTTHRFGFNTLHTKADGTVGLKRGQYESPIFAAWSLAESGEDGTLVLHDGPTEDGVILAVFRRDYECCSGWGVGTLTTPKGEIVGKISSSTWVSCFDIYDNKGTGLFRVSSAGWCTSGRMLIKGYNKDETLGLYKSPSYCCGGRHVMLFPEDLTVNHKLLLVTLLSIFHGSG